MIVAWQADPAWVAGWESLHRAANGRVPPSGRDDWRQGFAGLSGGARGVTGIADVFLERVPARRLVVLGEAGTGKTTLLRHLVLSLFASPSGLERVPVLVPLASWDATTEFEEWLETRLPAQHACLGGVPSHDTGEPSLVHALLKEQRLLLVLDGLDEMPRDVQQEALKKINGWLRPGEPLVLASRPEVYRRVAGLDAHSSPHHAAAWLGGAAVITMLPLDDAAVEAYVAGDLPNRGYADRWAPVFARLRSHGSEPVAEVMRVPLMLWLARSIYGPSGNVSYGWGGTLPDPVELCDRERFASVSELKEHLFRNFVPSAYRGGGHSARAPWDAESAGRILSYLARNRRFLRDSVRRDDVLPDNRWRWRLVAAVAALAAAGGVWLALQAVSRFLGQFPGWLMWVPGVWLVYVFLYIFGSLLPGSAEALFAPVRWWGWPVIAMAAVSWWLDWPGLWTIGWCVAAWIAFFPDPEEDRFRFEAGVTWATCGGVCCSIAWSVGALHVDLLIGLACGLAYQILRRRLARIERFWERLMTSPMPLAGAVGVAVAMALDLNWHGLDPDDLVSGWPHTPLGAALVCWLIVVVPHNIRYYWRRGWPEAPVRPRISWRFLPTRWLEAVAVLPVALWFGHRLEQDWRVLGAGILAAAWTLLIIRLPRRWAPFLTVFLPVRAYLHLQGRLPWRLKDFLEDAHERGVLRRNGTFYEFRHIELQRHLANQP
ncbi:NACHT domain-containing protein [Streptomyces sp. NPDC016566]|uniref:NACHT domain-containing protein n=1 Tax=Streptomyces sp. NPDC016566 TaxID=3364967 RepID=UPI0036F4FA6D